MNEKKSAEQEAGRTTAASDASEDSTAHQAGKRAGEGISQAARQYREYQLRILSATLANIDASFEYARAAIHAQSVSELMELSAGHSRRTWEKMAEQTREIAVAAQSFAAEASRRA